MRLGAGGVTSEAVRGTDFTVTSLRIEKRAYLIERKQHTVLRGQYYKSPSISNCVSS
jgi:hypothetical protein